MVAPRTQTFKVVGLTFVPEYPDNLHELRSFIESRQTKAIMGGEDPRPVPVSLVRNPENPHDANAIEVHVPALGRSSMVGHVPAYIAARMAPSMDSGVEWSAVVEVVLVDAAHSDKPGLSIIVSPQSLEPSI